MLGSAWRLSVSLLVSSSSMSIHVRPNLTHRGPSQNNRHLKINFLVWKLLFFHIYIQISINSVTYLIQWWLNLLTHICATRPRWVKYILIVLYARFHAKYMGYCDVRTYISCFTPYTCFWAITLAHLDHIDLAHFMQINSWSIYFTYLILCLFFPTYFH